VVVAVDVWIVVADVETVVVGDVDADVVADVVGVVVGVVVAVVRVHSPNEPPSKSATASSSTATVRLQSASEFDPDSTKPPGTTVTSAPTEPKLNSESIVRKSAVAAVRSATSLSALEAVTARCSSVMAVPWPSTTAAHSSATAGPRGGGTVTATLLPPLSHAASIRPTVAAVTEVGGVPVQSVGVKK